MNETISSNQTIFIDRFAAFFNLSPPSPDDIDRVVNALGNKSENIFLLDSETFVNELDLVFETTQLNQREAMRKRTGPQTNLSGKTILQEVLSCFAKFISESRELMSQIESRLALGRLDKSGGVMEMRGESETIEDFDEETDFRPRLGTLTPSNRHQSTDPFTHRTRLVAQPTTYNYFNFLSDTDQDLNLAISRKLQYFRDHSAELMEQHHLTEPSEENEQIGVQMTLMARVVLFPEDVSSSNFSAIKLEFLMTGNRVGSCLANFSQISRFILFSGQVVLVKGVFHRQGMFKVEALVDFPVHHPSVPLIREDPLSQRHLVVRGPFYQLSYKGRVDDKNNVSTPIFEQTPDFASIGSKLRHIINTYKPSSLIVQGPIVPVGVAEMSDRFTEDYIHLQTVFLNMLRSLPVSEVHFVPDIQEAGNYFPIPVNQTLPHDPKIRSTVSPVSFTDSSNFTIGVTMLDTLKRLRHQSLIRGEFTEQELTYGILRAFVQQQSLQPNVPFDQPFDVSAAEISILDRHALTASLLMSAFQ